MRKMNSPNRYELRTIRRKSNAVYKSTVFLFSLAKRKIKIGTFSDFLNLKGGPSNQQTRKSSLPVAILKGVDCLMSQDVIALE